MHQSASGPRHAPALAQRDGQVRGRKQMQQVGGAEHVVPRVGQLEPANIAEAEPPTLTKRADPGEHPRGGVDPLSRRAGRWAAREPTHHLVRAGFRDRRSARGRPARRAPPRWRPRSARATADGRTSGSGNPTPDRDRHRTRTRPRLHEPVRPARPRDCARRDHDLPRAALAQALVERRRARSDEPARTPPRGGREFRPRRRCR